MVKILCGCGCGKMFNKYDKRGRERRFVHGHGNKGKHNIIINKGNLGKNPNSHGNVKGKHWKIKDTSKMKGHKIWCEGQRSGIDKNCEICGKKFYTFPCQINKKYCSYKCAGISRVGKSCLNKGFKHTNLTIEKIKLARAKQIIGHRSPETIKKMKEGLKKTWRNPAMREAARQRRMKQILPVKNTSIEVKIQNFLKELHIEFYTHCYISEMRNKYQIDIFIPTLKIIIECDGCYWHGCPICNLKPYKKLEEQKERDKLRTNELINKGFKVLRLWEHEIKIMELNDLRDKIYG